MKKILFLVACMLGSIAMAQTNLLDPTPWTEGTGSTTGYGKYGATANNIREMGTDPFGDPAVVWKATPNPNSNAEGGIYTSYISADHTKKYRYSIWIKKTNSNDGRSYFGLHSQDASNAQATLRLNGALNTNPYFWSGDLPTLDEWYLLVGFLKPSDDTSTANEGQIFDSAGNAVGITIDYKMSPTVVRIRHRALLFNDPNLSDTQLHYGLAIYEVNGNEPSIQELINPGGNTGGGDTVWETSGGDINYTAGNVGIGTSSPDEALTVKGKIHTEEVIVDLNVPAPDYVFYKDYKLKTLEEVQQFINEFGHLPNIPSAKEMETDGVKLKEMNMKLLEKIEELTLYILEQEKRIKALEKNK